MKIFGFPTFNVVKVILTAEELGLDYEYVRVDPTKGEHKTPEYLAHHPLGKVPALEHNGESFIESHSICRYLAEANGNTLYSGDLLQRTRINEWLDMFGQHLGRWMGAYFFEEVVKPKLLGAETEAKKIEEAAGFLKGQLPVMESALGQHSYLAGDQISIADTVAFAYCQIQESTSLNFDAYPNIQLWYQRINERPSVARTAAKMAR